MLALSFSELGTTGAILLVVILFCVLGFIKGLVRMVFTFVALAGGIVGGLWGFRKGEAIAGTLVSNPDPWMSAAIGIILGLGIFFVARALFGVLVRPVGANVPKGKNLPLPGGLLGLLMGAVFAWFCLAGIRYIGTLSELEWLQRATADKTKIEKLPPPLFVKLKRGIDETALGKKHEEFDLFNDRVRSNLAKLVVLVQSKLAVATAATNKEAREAIFNTKINLMLLEKSADLKPFVEKGQFSHLLNSDIIREACRDEEVQNALAPIDLEKSLGLIEEKTEEEEEDPEEEGA